MDANDESNSKGGPGESALGESSAASDSAKPGRKPIDDTEGGSHERREHPQTADEPSADEENG